MRLLYIDIDTLRADHLGCYGYARATSENIDALAREGIRFESVYASDTPCLPSRTALITGRFGIHNGVVSHGGTGADLFTEGARRGFQSRTAYTSWARRMRSVGMHTATISTFAERHSAYHWDAGFNEVINLGTMGIETADMVAPLALEWLARNGARDNWFVHVHLWDPHTPYRTPAEYGEPFKHDATPGWITEEIRERHWRRPGPHSAQEMIGFKPAENPTAARTPRQPQQASSMAEVRAMFDGYDTGIKFADEHIGRLMNRLAELRVLDETAVMISGDHGETLGELGIYCDHHTADECVSHLPMVLKWPGLGAGRVERGMHYQIDIAATILQLLGARVPADSDGVGFAAELRAKAPSGREYLVLSHGAWTAQRAVRFGDHIAIRTYHDGYHGFPALMMFDLKRDPHETHDLAPEHPELAAEAMAKLEQWHAEQMARSWNGIDPIWTVLREGGPWHVRGHLREYLERLRETGRAEWADRLATEHRQE
ncbi:MAG: sulfatase [Candidatus Binataceae bacterium]